MQTFPSLPIAVIACKVFQGQIEQYLPEESLQRIQFLDYGLHSTPKKLKEAVQESIDRLEQPSIVVLGYGLCGNGLDGIQAREHVLLIARADDCIAILLGSYAAYRQEFDAHPGTYYLTKGWLESGSNPLSEYQKYVEKYGESSAEWIMDQQYQHYKRLVLVARTPEELERFRPQALDIARFCERWGMRYEELPGEDDYIRGLGSIVMGMEESNQDFIIVPPGGTLRQRDFIRG